MHFLMTVDVESFSIPLNREDAEIARLVYEVGLPRLLDLLSKHDVQSTFYFTGMFAEQSPESVELVKKHGHEIGCHGYDHSPQRAFDMLSYEEQVNELKKAKRVIEEVAGRIESFRAPMLRIHPNECLDTGDKISTTRRTNNLVEYLFADVIRHKLKLKNLGLASLKLLDEVITSAKEYGFGFVSVNEYRKLYKGIDYKL